MSAAGLSGTGATGLDYELVLAPAAAAARLRASVDAPRIGEALAPGLFRGRRIVGIVRGNDFELWVRRSSYNSLAPRAVGHFVPTARGSLLSVRIAAPRRTSIVFALIIAAAALGGAPILISVGYSPLAVLALVVLLVSVALFFRPAPASAGLPPSETAELHAFLDGVFRAQVFIADSEELADRTWEQHVSASNRQACQRHWRIDDALQLRDFRVQRCGNA